MEVYHYTSEEGLRQIQSSGYIRESLLSDKDAFYGQGVYLTTLPPAEGRKRIAKNNWEQLGLMMEQMGKVERAVKLTIPANKISRAQSGERDIWVHRGSIVLRNYTHSYISLDQGGWWWWSWCSIL